MNLKNTLLSTMNGKNILLIIICTAKIHKICRIASCVRHFQVQCGVIDTSIIAFLKCYQVLYYRENYFHHSLLRSCCDSNSLLLLWRQKGWTVFFVHLILKSECIQWFPERWNEQFRLYVLAGSFVVVWNLLTKRIRFHRYNNNNNNQAKEFLSPILVFTLFILHKYRQPNFDENIFYHMRLKSVCYYFVL